MSMLFETTTIGNLELANRFVRSATGMGMAGQDGSCTPKLIETMAELARGGVGLIITGLAHVQANGTAGPGMLGCYDDSLLPGLTQMTQAVHQAGGRIAIQIAHAGVFAPAELTGQDALGASAMPTEAGPLGREMTREEIQETVEAFGTAASRAAKAGFDGVQLHGAHGFLLNQFVSPFFNKRNDEYGGSLENRARMLLEVVRSVRDSVGDGYPVLVKLNSSDMLEGGISQDEVLEICAMLQQAGVDAIELSGGTILGIALSNFEISFSPVKARGVYYREAAEHYKEKMDIPLILVGGIRSFETARELVDDGVADYVALCRPLIREPDLVNRWQSGDRREADCISDNACAIAWLQGKEKWIRCVHLDQ